MKHGRAILTITNPPSRSSFDHTIGIYSESEKKMVSASGNSINPGPDEQRLQVGAYQAILMCLESKPLWASARFAITDGTTTDVPLTLEKSGCVRVSIRDKRSGNFPGGNNWQVEVHYKFGDNYGHIITINMGWGESKTATAGEFKYYMPPGSLKLIVKGSDIRWKDCVRTINLGAGEEQVVDFLLE